MIESAMALSKKYGTEFEPLMQHVWDLIRRFGNTALGDTCARVGADIPRKLSRTDRLIGAAENCLSQGIAPVYICVGAAAALHDYIKQNPDKDPDGSFAELTGLEPDSFITKTVLKFYGLFSNGAGLDEITAAADKIKKAETGMIV